MLEGGDVVFSGGFGADGRLLRTLELYHRSLPTSQAGHAMTVAADSRVVITGGLSSDDPESALESVGHVDVIDKSADMIEVTSSVTSNVPGLTAPALAIEAYVLADGTIALIGGRR